MYTWVCEKDVACVYGWYTDESYKDLKFPETPLLLASLMEHQYKSFKTTLKENGWKRAGWYLGCHEEIRNAEKIHLFYKIQNVPAKGEILKGGDKIPFNEYIPLACSVQPHKTMVKLTSVVDMHRTMGIHRSTKKSNLKHSGHWHKFATTELADYWFWGLLPTEKDRFKIEGK